MTDNNFNKKIFFLIQQAGMLLQMPRSHVRNLGNSFDTIASHSHHVSVIAYCIARMENLSHEESMKAMAMASFHDLAEGRTADLDFVSKNYTQDDEERAIKDQFKGIDFGEDLLKLLEEYGERKTLLAKCVKDADQVAQMFHVWALMWRGNKIAQQWFESGFVSRVPYFFTESAKKIVFSMKESNPNEWWWSEFVEESGEAKTKKHLLGKNYKED